MTTTPAVNLAAFPLHSMVTVVANPHDHLGGTRWIVVGHIGDDIKLAKHMDDSVEMYVNARRCTPDEFRGETPAQFAKTLENEEVSALSAIDTRLRMELAAIQSRIDAVRTELKLR